MKKCFRKKVLIVKESQSDPLYQCSPKTDQVDNENKDMGQSYMIQEKVINNLKILEVGHVQYLWVSMRCLKSNLPVGFIVFDEPELIVFVIQGLSLSSASLVNCLVNKNN